MSDEGKIIALPYGKGRDANSGWRGSQTSEDRARVADASGETGARQAYVLRLLHGQGERGLTWKQIDEITGWHHHGKTTGALSNLHKVGRIARLTEVRDKCKVYVLPAFVNGRDVEPQGSKTAEPSLLAQAIDLMRESVGETCRLHGIPNRDCWACRATRLIRIYDAG